MELSYDPEMPRLSIHAKKIKTIYTPHIACNLIYNREDMETTWSVINGEMDKVIVAYIQTQRNFIQW